MGGKKGSRLKRPSPFIPVGLIQANRTGSGADGSLSQNAAECTPPKRDPQRITPVCPSEWLPGWGQTAMPWGVWPTGMMSTWPVAVSMA